MRHLALTVSYDGTRYAGFQVQKNALTVQAILQKTLRQILKENIRLLSSGRTDAGVHALGHLVSFKTASAISGGALKRALNSLLPPDVAVVKVESVPLSFHPRFDKALKTYRYTLRNHPSRSPFDRLYTTFYPRPLDLSAMKRAAGHFKGRKNFKSFQAKDKKERSSIRQIRRISVRRHSPYVFIEIEGNGFLYKMVRNIVGTLLEVGRGRRKPEEIRRLLLKKDRRFAGPTAPARGLCLLKVTHRSR